MIVHGVGTDPRDALWGALEIFEVMKCSLKNLSWSPWS